jgi:predicted nuclease with RNAse H fold
VLTVGVDLAAEAVRTALAAVEWSAGRAEVTGLSVDVGDDEIVETILRADKAGIDCPIGWPTAFVEFVAAHHAGHVVTPADVAGRDWRRGLAYRHTDLVVREATGLVPLSVAADRIAHPAMRCAGLLARLADAGRPVDRGGDGVVVEVYPAASLKQWGLPHRGYKRTKNLSGLDRLVDDLLAAAPWLDLGPYESLCRRSDDALDAVIAALTARAVTQGMTARPGAEQLTAAAAEGWIAYPTVPLGRLRP